MTIDRYSSWQDAAVSLGHCAAGTGPEDQKLEKQLAQFDVFFIQNHTPVQLGLNFVSDKCDRCFQMHTDRPLMDPDTLESMKTVDVQIAASAHISAPRQKLF